MHTSAPLFYMLNGYVRGRRYVKMGFYGAVAQKKKENEPCLLEKFNKSHKK